MSRPIRHVAADRYYMLTNRCALGQFVMRPDEETKRILKGCLARAVDKYDVELVCFVFLSNHFHLIARFPARNMSEFMGEFQSQIASRLNDHRDRDGTVFPERYDDKALLDARVLEDKIAYVLNNPVKDGLVPRATDWPGVSSLELHAEDEPLVGKWLDGKEWTKLKRRKGEHTREEAMQTHRVELHLPEALGETCEGPIQAACDGGEPSEADREARIERLMALVERDRRRLWKAATGSAGRPPETPTPEALVEWDWSYIPPESPSSPFDRRRLGVASRPEAMEDYRERRRQISESYRALSAKWREGKRVDPEEFPPGTYPPTCRHCVDPPAA